MKLTKQTIKKIIQEEVEGAFLESEPFDQLPKRLKLLSAAVNHAAATGDASTAHKMIDALERHINMEAKRLKRGY